MLRPRIPFIRTRVLAFASALVLAVLAVLVPSSPAIAQEEGSAQRQQLTADDYNRAERMLGWHASDLVSGDEVEPEWLEDGYRFWYRNKIENGHRFVLVDPGANSQGPLFDHHRLAAAMSMANDTAYEGRRLPFDDFEWVEELRRIAFELGEKRFECDIRDYTCVVGEPDEDDEAYVQSPDGRWEVFARDYDLWLRPAGGGDSIRLTTDGEQFWSYGVGDPDPYDLLRGDTVDSPDVEWSPDGRRLAVTRQDERGVEHMHYISMTSQRPRHFSQPYALPGDTVIPYPGIHVLTLDFDEAVADDVAGGAGAAGPNPDPVPQVADVRVASNVAVEMEPTPHRSSFDGSLPDSAWSRDGERLRVTYFTRGSKKVYLADVDATTGSSRVLAGDSMKTFVELHSGNGPESWWVSDESDDVIWWSERDGWGHLYLYDKAGNVKNRITSGPWLVEAVRHVDGANRRIYFTAVGREDGVNIYYPHLYRVNFDGSGLTLLTPEPAAHEIEFSPDGRFFVDSYSTISEPPVTLLRAAPDGRVVRTLEEADISRLVEAGWTPPEVFSVKARDGVTDLYGLIHFPPDLDPSKQYPIISSIYPGPQVGSVGSWDFQGSGEEISLARLGFVVMELDHLGTPLRSKKFHDNYFGDFNDNGLPDHVTAIKQLAARYSFIDLDRVGMYGHSGGGFATADAMFRHPDFFKVGVSGAGNHDNRSYNIYWAEKYQGPMEYDDEGNPIDHFEDEANQMHAENLEGKLLLMHGDMDDNVHPAMTIKVVNELIEANKDFDMIIAPDRAHGLNEPFFVRKRWDYFVEHLLGADPPKEYQIVRPEN